MPRTPGKNLHMFFRCPFSPQSSPDPLDPDEDDHSRPLHSSSQFRNVNSLYDYGTLDSTSKSIIRTHSPETEFFSEPDFATVVASQRFFFPSPGRSNSISDFTPSVAATESSDTPVSISPMDQSNHSSNSFFQESIPSWSSTTCVKDSVAVPADATDPYMDFKRSMQQMVEARDLVDVEANWYFLHELLVCYLALNPKSAHKFIINAFSDLLVSLKAQPKMET